MFPISAPFAFFVDRNGDPLQDGYIYFGLVNQNPKTAPTVVYWDKAGTKPAAQPIRTINGYPVRNGAPAQIYIAGDHSISVYDRDNQLVITEMDATDAFGAGSVQTANLADGAVTTPKLADDAVTAGKMHAAAPDVVFGRATAGAGAGEEIPCTAVARTFLAATTQANQRAALSAAKSGAITGSDLTIATAKMAGRSTSGTGALEEIAVGAGLKLLSGVLSLATQVTFDYDNTAGSTTSQAGAYSNSGTPPGTAPAYNEGALAFKKAFTPMNASAKLIIFASAFFASSTDAIGTITAFLVDRRTDTVIARATVNNSSGNNGGNMMLFAIVDAGTTDARDIEVRYGTADGSYTAYYNQNNAGYGQGYQGCIGVIELA